MARSALKMALCRPCQAIREPVGHLEGINKAAAWGVRLLPTSTSAHAMVWAHCAGLLLNKQFGCLGLKFPGPTHPLYMTFMTL